MTKCILPAALVAGAASLLVADMSASSACAADGFKASATLSKRVPADILVVSFHLIERSHPEREARLRKEEARIRDEIRNAGVTIQSWSSQIALTNAGFNSTTFNYINPGSNENQAVDVRRNIVVQMTGLADAAPVAAVLGRNAIRHGVTFQWRASTSAKAREELSLEAIKEAVAKARLFAAQAGGKAGTVLDVSVSAPPQQANDVMRVGNSTVTVHGPPVPSDEIVEDEQGLGMNVKATATVIVQAKPD